MPHTKNEKANKPVENLGDFMQFGYYSIFFIVMYELLILPQMSNMTFMIYAGSAPTVVSCGNHSLRHFTSNVEACAEMRSLQADTGCEPGIETQFGSLAFEFGYICEKIVDVKKSISAQMFGVLCGALFFGQLSDWFGRKKIMLLCHVGMLVLDYAASYSGSLTQFTWIQFCAMFFVGGHNTVVHVFLLENMPKRHRVWVMTALSYSPNYVIFAGVSYLAGDWRTLIRIAGLMNIPAFFVLLCAFESPRWLIQKMKLETARSVLIKIERFNGTATEERLKIVDELIEKETMACESKKRGKKYYLFHLFYTSKMCCYSAIISYALLCTSIISYALIFNMEHLSGSIFLNSALFGLFRYSMNLLVGSLDYFIPRAGRKPVHHAALSFILVMLSVVFVSKLLDLNDATILRVTTLSAAAMCSQLYMVNAVVTSELFPTAVRNLAASFVQISSRTGAVLSPHLFYLASLWEPLPFLLMLVLMAMNMLLFGPTSATDGSTGVISISSNTNASTLTVPSTIAPRPCFSGNIYQGFTEVVCPQNATCDGSNSCIFFNETYVYPKSTSRCSAPDPTAWNVTCWTGMDLNAYVEPCSNTNYTCITTLVAGIHYRGCGPADSCETLPRNRTNITMCTSCFPRGEGEPCNTLEITEVSEAATISLSVTLIAVIALITVT